MLAPGWLLARSLGIRSASATLAWSLILVFAALAATFAFGGTLSLTLLLLAIAAAVAVAIAAQRGFRRVETLPGRSRAFFWGAIVGLLLWVAAPTVQGDGLFHLARIRKLLDLHDLSLDRVSEFADGSLHPGYAFPLWHGFLALIAKLAGEDPERVVVHLPSILAPLAVVVAFEAGWALFRRTWAAGVTAGAQVAMICFAPGTGGAYVFLSLPATASRQLLVPAALALALETIRAPSRALVLSTAASGLALAAVHPTYAIFLWIPFVGFLVVRALWDRADVRPGVLALGSLVVPAALFMLWLRPIVNDTRSVSPGCRGAAARVRAVPRPARRPLGHVVQPRTRGVHARRCGGDRGAPARPACRPRGTAALGGVRRGRLARGVRGHAAAVPLSVARRPRLDLAGATRGGLPSLRLRLRGRHGRARAARRAHPAPALARRGHVPPDRLSGRLRLRAQRTRLPRGSPGSSVVGAVVALVVGLLRRRPALETGAALAAAAFLIPVVAGGLLDLRPAAACPRSRRFRTGSCAPCATSVAAGDVVFSDPETSFRLAAFAPVYIAVGSARSRRRHGEEPAVRARARRSPLPRDRRRRDSARGTAPSTSSSTASDEARSSICRGLPRRALRALPVPA